MSHFPVVLVRPRVLFWFLLLLMHLLLNYLVIDVITWVELCLFQVVVVAETRNQGHSREMIEAVREKFGQITVSAMGKALAEANGVMNGSEDSDEESDNFQEDLLRSDTNWLAAGTTIARARRQSIGIAEMTL